MNLSLIKELSRHSYICGEQSSKYYYLANEDGIDIYNLKDNTLLFSFVNFQAIIEILVTYDERFLICLNRNDELLCFDLINKEHVTTLTNFTNNYGHILSLTTSINRKEVIIIYSDNKDKNKSKMIRLSIPLFNLISVTSFENKFISIRKSKVFSHYYLINNNKISYYDLNFSYIGNISLNTDILNIKNCISLDSPKRLLIQDFKKVYLLNSKYELYDEFSLINNDSFIMKYRSPEDVLNLKLEDDISIIFDSDICYSTGVYKDKYLVSLSNNILLKKPRFKLFDFSTTELLVNLKILSNISTVLLLPNYILISGSNGTYLFNENEKSELIISNPNTSSLGIIHKERLINEIISNTT